MTDRVAVRLIDRHGLVAVVRVDSDGRAYLRSKAFSFHNLYWLDDIDPSSMVAVICRSSRHIIAPVAVASLQQAVSRYRSTGVVEKLTLPEEPHWSPEEPPWSA